MPEVVEDSPPPAADQEPAEPEDESASMQFMVTNEMRAQLEKLGYKSAEIDELNAERAAAIIARNIAKPRAGVPPTWNRQARVKPLRGLMGRITPGKMTSGGGAALAGSLVAAIGALAVGMLGRGVKPAPLPILEEVIATPDDGFVPSDASMWLDRLIDDTILRIKLALKRR
jgi:hypothetical protein